MLSPPTRAKTSLIYPMAHGPVHDVGAQQILVDSNWQ